MWKGIRSAALLVTCSILVLSAGPGLADGVANTTLDAICQDASRYLLPDAAGAGTVATDPANRELRDEIIADILCDRQDQAVEKCRQHGIKTKKLGAFYCLRQLHPGPIARRGSRKKEPTVYSPMLLWRVDPEFPDTARQDAFHALVKMQITIGRDGKVTETKVLGSSHSGLGLERLAVDAVRQWRYAPAMQDHRPVATYSEIRFAPESRGWMIENSATIRASYDRAQAGFNDGNREEAFRQWLVLAGEGYPPAQHTVADLY